MEENRILLTHDASTMLSAAYERIRLSVHFAGVVVIPQWLSIGLAVLDILPLDREFSAEELRDRVLYLPFRQ